MNSLSEIQDFLAQKRVAMVGVSRNPHEFSRMLFREFAQRGYDVVPVHPGLEEVEGRHCFERAQKIQPPAEAALLLTAPATTEQVVEDCAAAGITRIWMYRACTKAIQYCQSRGIELIAGECPLMFFPNARGIHRFHGLLKKITRTYPR